MLDIKLVNTDPNLVITSAQSVERFTVSGRKVHNKEFNHMIKAYPGRCCEYVREHLHLSAQATVISQYTQVLPVVHALAVDDEIKVNGKIYVVTPRPFSDPVLVPKEG